MKKSIVVSAVLIICLFGTLLFLRHTNHSTNETIKSPEVTIVEAFYRNYLTNKSYKDKNIKEYIHELFSKSFNELYDLNHKVCN